MKEKDSTLSLIYFKVTDLWRRLCEKHSELLDLTLDEYKLLLNSDIDGVEKLIEKKSFLIESIGQLEKLRSEIIKDLNLYLEKNNQKVVNNVSELISLMNLFEETNKNYYLKRFNTLLIDIIEKLQDQNKKNQIFLNKAIHNLKEIREEAMGVKNYSTYNKQGVSSKPLG